MNCKIKDLVGEYTYDVNNNEKSIRLDSNNYVKINKDGKTLTFEKNHGEVIASFNPEAIANLLHLIDSIGLEYHPITEIVDEVKNHIDEVRSALPGELKKISPDSELLSDYLMSIGYNDCYGPNSEGKEDLIKRKLNERYRIVLDNRDRDYNSSYVSDAVADDVAMSYFASSGVSKMQVGPMGSPYLEFVKTHMEVFGYGNKDNPFYGRIPSSGKADDYPSELYNECHYILYRYFNDGDNAQNIFEPNFLPRIAIKQTFDDLSKLDNDVLSAYLNYAYSYMEVMNKCSIVDYSNVKFIQYGDDVEFIDKDKIKEEVDSLDIYKRILAIHKDGDEITEDEFIRFYGSMSNLYTNIKWRFNDGKIPYEQVKKLNEYHKEDYFFKSYKNGKLYDTVADNAEFYIKVRKRSNIFITTSTYLYDINNFKILIENGVSSNFRYTRKDQIKEVEKAKQNYENYKSHEIDYNNTEDSDYYNPGRVDMYLDGCDASDAAGLMVALYLACKDIPDFLKDINNDYFLRDGSIFETNGSRYDW